MPWNNQSGGGGWKGGNGGPWGQGPRNSGPTPPDLEELLRRSQDRLKRVLPGGGRNLSPLTLIAILAVAAAIIAYNFFTFRVQPDEVGVVLRFGRYDHLSQPGLNFRLPYPIDTVYTPKVTRVNRVTVGQSTDDQGASGRDLSEESLMLTGDENIVDITFAVFWVINDASKYLFNMEDPDGSVKAVAESAMREIVGTSEHRAAADQGQGSRPNRRCRSSFSGRSRRMAPGSRSPQVQLLRVDPPADVVRLSATCRPRRQTRFAFRTRRKPTPTRLCPRRAGRARRSRTPPTPIDSA